MSDSIGPRRRQMIAGALTFLAACAAVVFVLLILSGCAAEPDVAVRRPWQPVAICDGDWLTAHVLPCWRLMGDCKPGDPCIWSWSKP